LRNKIIMINIYKLNRLHPVFFLLTIAVIAVILSTFVEKITYQEIAGEQEQGILYQIQVIFPLIDYYSYDDAESIYTVYDSTKKVIGYAFYAEGIGFSGKMEILVGLEDKETIKGIHIISIDDGLWIGESDVVDLDFTPFTEQFEDLKIDDCKLKRRFGESEGKVDGITGATVSSRAIVDTVREAALEKVEFID
jgi:Na+-translocating ferredoxin:NAD+ oxidoreductase RnfG subunit